AEFATDHGPSGFSNEGGKRHHDELNIIRAGGNYGWPVAFGASKDHRFVSPLLDWTPAIAPAGLAFRNSRLYVSALKGQQLREVTVQRDQNSPLGWRVIRQRTLLAGQRGRIRAVSVAQGGSLLITTSNRDDNSKRKLVGDDKVLRVRNIP
ncbi:PQQ-dependent sugar dehydrogenase, partial [bacterium]